MFKHTKTYSKTDGGDFFDLVGKIVSMHGSVMVEKNKRVGYQGIKLDLLDEGKVFVSVQTWMSEQDFNNWKDYTTNLQVFQDWKVQMDQFLADNNIVVVDTFETV